MSDLASPPADPAVPAIAVEGLAKTFPGGRRALKGVSLTIDRGEMVALIGASGSGKSTLIRHVAGLIAADRRGGGRVAVLGETVQDNGRLARRAVALRRRVGVVFQQFNLVPRLRVMTNVLVGILGAIPAWRGALGLFTHAEKQAAMVALDRVGIAPSAMQRAATLSGGQQQRAAIARALVQGAEIVLADEPIASLDPASAKRVMEILTTINQDDGITIVVSLHQVEYARRYCARTIAMRDGEVVFDGPSRELTLAFLREIYGEASDELVLPDAADGLDRVAPAALSA
ncbi:MAG: phosphonate ABC transporter ATP-binding protein [Pseudomonadota bacterium]